MLFSSTGVVIIVLLVGDVHDILFFLLLVGVVHDLLLFLGVDDIPDDTGGSSR